MIEASQITIYRLPENLDSRPSYIVNYLNQITRISGLLKHLRDADFSLHNETIELSKFDVDPSLEPADFILGDIRDSYDSASMRVVSKRTLNGQVGICLNLSRNGFLSKTSYSSMQCDNGGIVTSFQTFESGLVTSTKKSSDVSVFTQTLEFAESVCLNRLALGRG